eukprot:COSAG05_NODE_3107_length_2319_cov_1.320721_3_plen_239_part_00
MPQRAAGADQAASTAAAEVYTSSSSSSSSSARSRPRRTCFRAGEELSCPGCGARMRAPREAVALRCHRAYCQKIVDPDDDDCRTSTRPETAPDRTNTGKRCRTLLGDPSPQDLEALWQANRNLAAARRVDAKRSATSPRRAPTVKVIPRNIRDTTPEGKFRRFRYHAGADPRSPGQAYSNHRGYSSESIGEELEQCRLSVATSSATRRLTPKGMVRKKVRSCQKANRYDGQAQASRDT